MKTTLGKLVDASPSMQKLAVQDLPVKTAYAISRTIKAVDDHLETYEAQYAKLLERYCEEKEDGRWAAKSPEDKKGMDEDLRALRGIEVELAIKACRIPEAAADSLSLSGFDIINLADFVEFDFGDEKPKTKKNKKEDKQNGND